MRTSRPSPPAKAPRGSRAAARVRRLVFQGLSAPVMLADAPAVEQGLRRVLRDWHFASAPAGADAAGPAPLSVVTRRRGRYRLWSQWLDDPLDGLAVASAACGVLADLSQSFGAERPGWLALHCGAALFGHRLVLFGGPARAGKSTLIARLTAEPGVTVLCDDVLPLTEAGTGFGLGIAPRLRLPLPGTAAPAFRDHVARHVTLSDDRYAYLDAGTVAPHGTTAPVTAVVALLREPGAAPRLHRMDPVEATGYLLERNIAEPGAAARTLDRLARMAADALVLRLVYDDLEPAVALLRAAFGAPGAAPSGVPIHPARPGDTAQTAVPAAVPVPAGSRWRRVPGVAMRRVGEGAVLWNSRSLSTFRLNPVAAAVWQLLAGPLTCEDVACVLAEAFPDEPAARIAADVALLLGAMEAGGVVEAAPAAGVTRTR